MLESNQRPLASEANALSS